MAGTLIVTSVRHQLHQKRVVIWRHNRSSVCRCTVQTDSHALRTSKYLCTKQWCHWVKTARAISVPYPPLISLFLVPSLFPLFTSPPLPTPHNLPYLFHHLISSPPFARPFPSTLLHSLNPVSSLGLAKLWGSQFTKPLQHFYFISFLFHMRNIFLVTSVGVLRVSTQTDDSSTMLIIIMIYDLPGGDTIAPAYADALSRRIPMPSALRNTCVQNIGATGLKQLVQNLSPILPYFPYSSSLLFFHFLLPLPCFPVNFVL